MKKTALALIAALVVTTNIAFAQVKALSSATIHDTKFTDVSVKENAKETLYLTWFMITSDYMIERYKGHFTAAELKLAESAIEKNYNFLMEKILGLGKKM